jgi:hypothetical protein
MGRDYYEAIHHMNLIEMLKPNGLVQIGELPDLVRFISTEPKFFDAFPHELKCPDAFINYLNDCWTIIELKHTMKSKEKGFRQIESGYELIHSTFKVPYERIKGKLVTYENPFEFADYKPRKHFNIDKSKIENYTGGNK